MSELYFRGRPVIWNLVKGVHTLETPLLTIRIFEDDELLGFQCPQWDTRFHILQSTSIAAAQREAVKEVRNHFELLHEESVKVFSKFGRARLKDIEK
jgi:hypothetical protein